jgi:hypothetical protein
MEAVSAGWLVWTVWTFVVVFTPTSWVVRGWYRVVHLGRFAGG